MSEMSKHMIEGMEKSSGHVAVDEGVGIPKAGEKFRCDVCGMELKITQDCRCEEDDMVHFHCCGKEMVKA